MTFLHQHEVAPGEPATTPATTIHIERDKYGNTEYVRELGPGNQLGAQ